MDPAFLPPLEEMAFTEWREAAYSRDAIGRFARKLASASPGMSFTLPGGVRVKKKPSGGFSVFAPGASGKARIVDDAKAAAIAALDRAAQSRDPRSPGGTTSHRSFEEAGKRVSKTGPRSRAPRRRSLSSLSPVRADEGPFLAPLVERDELGLLLEAFGAFGDWNPDLHPRDWLGRFRLVRPLGGGGGGAYLVKSSRSGKEYVAKRGNAPGHVRSEYAANQIYEAAGVRVPKTRYENGIQVGSVVDGRELNDFLERKPDGRLAPKPYYEDEWRTVRGRIADGFAMDALLANWDVLGPKMNNVMVDRDLQPYRVDQGGAMGFSGFGTPKPKWDPTVGEFESMRNPERSVSVVYGGLDDVEVREQIWNLPEGSILARVDRLVGSGDLSAEDASTIRARLAYMRKWAGEDETTSFRVAAAAEERFLAPLSEAGFGSFNPSPRESPAASFLAPLAG